MTLTNIVVLFGGLVLIGGIAWFFRGPRKSGQRAALSTSGYQEAMILVKGGYTPDVIVVQHGKPVRLNFRREETAACSEMVILNDFGKSAQLPTGGNGSGGVSTRESRRVWVLLPDGYVPWQTHCRVRRQIHL